MTYTVLMLCILLGTLQVEVVTGLFDTGNYQILSDANEETFNNQAAKCRGELNKLILNDAFTCLGDTITENTLRELGVLFHTIQTALEFDRYI